MKSEKDRPPISALSDHLFWDTPRERISWERNGKWLVARIVQYGRVEDWELLKEAYSISELGELAIAIRYLEPKALSFLSLVLEIPKEKFRCYRERSLNQGHWIY